MNILFVSLIIQSIAFGADSSRINRFISESRIRWNEKSFASLPQGFSYDETKGEVSSLDYFLRLEKDSGGLLKSLRELKRTRLPEGASGESNDSYEYSKTNFDGDGNPVLRTLCTGNRSISSLKTFFGIGEKGIPLWGSNKRTLKCRTLTAKVCKAIETGLTTEFNDYAKKAKEFVDTCNAYSKKFLNILKSAYKEYPENLLSRETNAASEAMTKAMSSNLLSFSSLNVSQVLVEKSADERSEDVNGGFAAMSELMAIHESCGAEASRIPEWGLGAKAPAVAPTPRAAR